ncbi:MAG: hypothetical protein ACKOW8_08615 [Flavobacteriales bacterium]
MLVVFGLNKDIWQQIASSERYLYNWAARLYILSCILSAGAGMRFMHQLSDSYSIGIVGGLLVGYIVSVVTRIALITMVSLPIIPVQSGNNSTDSHAATTTPLSSPKLSQPKSLPSTLPNFSVVFRMCIIALMSLVVAMPLAAIIGYSQAEFISEQRRSVVIQEFKANHPDMTTEQNRVLMSHLQADHFPIHVYQVMAQQPIGVFSIALAAACFLVPFFMLWHLRKGPQFQYAVMNRDLLIKQIETDYAITLEQSRRLQNGRYKLTETILPHQAWLDAPFNTRSIAEQMQYSIETETVFLERMKGL